MKRCMMRMITVLMIVIFSGATLISVDASDNDVITQMIEYYKFHGDAAHTDIMRLTQELAVNEPNRAKAWNDIMTYWEYVNNGMEVHADILPDGLPEDNTLCITVLGFALNADGSMKEELIGRLQVARDSAEKYPNAYIACTGGGTAAQNPLVTEADQMAAWLLEQGIDKERIIVENRSKSTVQNAQLTYAILRRKYPQITNLAIVTSDYHVPRGCLLYNAQLILSAYKANDVPLNVVSNAGYRAGHSGYEAVSLQASGVAQIAGVSLNSTAPKLSTLSQINVQGKQHYKRGEPLDLQVTASYDSGFAYTVTDCTSFTGYDPYQTGAQIVMATYRENNVQKTCEITVRVSGGFMWLIVVGIISAILLISALLFMLMKKKQRNC